MITPAYAPLRADRNADLPISVAIGFGDDVLDLTGCDLEAQIRDYPNAPGAPRVSLGVVADDALAEGIHIVDVLRGEIEVLVRRTTLQALPGDYDPARPRRFAWDLRVTYPDGLSEIYVAGPLILHPGVTRDA